MSLELVGDVLSALSNIAIIGGLPLAVVAFALDRRQARQNEVQEIYVLLGDSYTEFVRLALSTPELRIWDKHDNDGLTPEQLSQKWALFEVLISVFERAYTFSYSLPRRGGNARDWQAWQSHMRRWCARRDFSDWLDELVEDEDPDFAAFILALGAAQANRPARRFDAQGRVSSTR